MRDIEFLYRTVHARYYEQRNSGVFALFNQGKASLKQVI